MAVILSLLVAHLLGDFLLQRESVVTGKAVGRVSAFVEHGAVHLLCLVGAWLAFSPLPLMTLEVWSAFAGIVGLHLASDWVKSTFKWSRPVLAFAVDQTFHLLVLVAAAVLLAGEYLPLAAAADWWRAWSTAAALLLAGYLGAIFAAGWLNFVLLKSMAPADSPGLVRAGLYIGWLERFLMLTAVLVQAWAALGLILAAKSIFRFEAIRRDRRHAEYFVIGTLVSVSEVVLVGALLWWLMPQAVPA